jgi:hypothetical protein
LILQDGRSITLPSVLHILGLEINLIFFIKMSGVGVHTLFQNNTCKMVRVAMLLMKGVQIGSLYNLIGNFKLTGCNDIVVLDVDSN